MISTILVQTLQTLQRLHHANLELLDLTWPQFQVLHTLHELPSPPSQSQLAHTLHIDRTSMVKHLDALQSASLIQRVNHPSDRRAYLVKLTDKSATIYPRALQLISQGESQALQNLTPKQQENLKRLIEKL